jgi:hydrogenase nickel incorporation protein HypB
MCSTCGCGNPDGVRVIDLRAQPHDHDHQHDHDHARHHDHGTETLVLEQAVLAKNDALAGRNRDWLKAHGIAAINMMSSPGSGKTTLLERTVRELGDSRPLGVIEGDQETLLDADRIQAAGAQAVQVNTGAGCHLDADMMDNALQKLAPADGSLVFVENVGNLVCPALFDLGESARVTVISVTEGADKPAKYPYMFRSTDLVVLNKIDLLPYVDFDVDRCVDLIHQINEDATVLRLSAARGDGVDEWYRWLAAV